MSKTYGVRAGIRDQNHRRANVFAILLSLPGLATWAAWFIAPHWLPSGPGNAMILVPFLGCLMVNCLFAVFVVANGACDRWCRLLNAASNLSFPIFSLIVWFTSGLLR